MTDEYKVLSAEEYETLKNSISWITILIASADGVIDPKETEWAEKLASIRGFTLPKELKGFYKDVGDDFHERLHNMIAVMPENNEERMALLTENLKSINPIMAKLDPSVGAPLYDSFKSFAKHVAKASGGFLRFFSISAEEKKYIDLKMITPVEYFPEDNNPI
jgi:hypothetical protein